MLPIVSADTIYSFAQSTNEANLYEVADEFWEYLLQSNPVLLEYLIGFTEKLNSKITRSIFLSGVYTAIILLKRQDDAEELDRMFGETE